MRAIGIDIGTTTICGLLYEVETKKVLDQLTLANVQPSASSGIQDPLSILSSVETILDRLSAGGADVISFSAQMHGIVYVDEKGEAVSPFYTWQNQWGKEKGIEEEISRILGYNVFTGYGLVTHKALEKLPDKAVCFCNIGDFVTMRLAGKTAPVCDSSIAASLGIWDVSAGKVTEAFPEDSRFFPEVVEDAVVVGCWKGIPVVTPLGDNQCSFLGSVLSLEEDIVLSYGTSGQISFYSEEPKALPRFEKRPLGSKGGLQVAFSLTGGESFQILADFFQEVIELCGLKLDKPVYRVLDALEYLEEDKTMKCEPFFLGERGNSSSLASFSQITTGNFTPKAMTYALMDGMAWELYRFYESLPEEIKRSKSRLIGTGNGLRKNPHLQKIIAEKYGKELLLPEIQEGSCIGAIMNALVALGCYPSYKEVVKAFTE